jgi:hypothetical protein
MMFALVGYRRRWLLDSAVGVNLDEGPGPVSTQTLMFLFAGIGVSAAVVRLGKRAAAGYLRLIRPGLAGHDG